MDHRRSQWFEKVQVQVVTVAAVAAAYWLLVPLLRGWDAAEGPLTFLPAAQAGRLAVLAGGVWVLAAVMGPLTVRVRP